MRILTEHVYPDLTDLMAGARAVLMLASPYWDLPERLWTEMERATDRGVQVILIARGGSDRAKQEVALSPVRARVPRAQVYFVERLHAKVYLSDSEAIVTSLNLVESSILDSIEVGVRLARVDHPEEHQRLFKFCETLVTKGVQDLQRARPTPTAEPPRARPAPLQRERPQAEGPPGVRRRSKGHCIRCADDIDLNDERPLCGDCYAIWAEYKNPDYEERHCHACGRESATSMSKPLCRACWKRSTA